MADDLAKDLAQAAGDARAARRAQAAARRAQSPTRPGTPEEATDDELAQYDALTSAGLTTLFGFLADRLIGGRYRLYLTLRLDEYVEIDPDDVLRRRELPESGEVPFGGTCLWVRRGAELQHTRVTSRAVQAELLSGSLAQGDGAGSPATLGADRGLNLRAFNLSEIEPRGTVSVTGSINCEPPPTRG